MIWNQTTANIVATRKSNILGYDIPYIKTVRFISNPAEGIAKSRRSTGELVINRYYFDDLPDEHKLFVLLHEAGHIGLNTVDELAADKFASDLYLKAGFPISESVKALAEHLNDKNPVHLARAWAQYQRALQWDYRHNNNQKAFRPHYEGEGEIKQKLKAMTVQNNFSPEWTNFLGIAIGKKARAKKAATQEVKLQKKLAKVENIKSKAQSRLELAKKGIVTPGIGDTIGKSLAGVAGLASNLLGGGGQQQAPEVQQSMPDLMSQVPPAIFNTGGDRSMGSMSGDSTYVPDVQQVYEAAKQTAPGQNAGTAADEKDKDKNKNTGLIIGGVVGLVLLLAVVFMMKK